MTSTAVPLPPQTSSDPLLLQNSSPPRPAPRRTYGRARPASPRPAADDDDDTSISRARSFLAPHVSPAKGLLDRWSNASATWLGGLGDMDLDAPAPVAEKSIRERLDLSARLPLRADDEREVTDREEDEEAELRAARREMERMRREARGLPPPPPQARNQLVVPAQPVAGTSRLGVSFSSSSLSELPPSSPPKTTFGRFSSDAAVDEETIPIRKSGLAKPHGKQRRIVESDEDDDEATSIRLPKIDSVHETSAQAASPLETRRRQSSPGETSTADEDEGADEPTTNLDDNFWAALETEQEPEPALAMPHRRSSRSSAEPMGLFDDENEISGRGQEKGKAKKIKALNVKEQMEMRKDIARAARDKHIMPAKPEPTRMPLSHWLLNAGDALGFNRSAKVDSKTDSTPGLTFSRSPVTSPPHATPQSPIAQFTPSSALPNQSGAKDTVMAAVSTSDQAIQISSSPTARKSKARARRVAETSDAEDEEDAPVEDLEAMMARLDKQREEEELRRVKEDKARRLREFKERLLKEQASRNPEVDEEELHIAKESPQKPAVVSTKVDPGKKKHGPDAKAVLSKTSDIPALSRNRQQHLLRAGVSARAHAHHAETTTETYALFAAKTFDHANLRAANAGSRPNTVKAGRDRGLTQREVDEMIKRRHAEQVGQVAKKKEEEWGRVRKLPERQGVDVEKMAEEVRDVRDYAEGQDEEEGAEEDDDDDDWIPSGEEDEELEGSEREEDGEDVMLSGQEDAGEGEADLDVADEAEIDAGDDQGNLVATVSIADEDEDVTPTIVRRKPRATRIDSDDEDEGDTALRASSAKPPTPVANNDANIMQNTPQSAEISIDLAGFGSGSGGDGSPGFSQLFEPTQPADQATAKDAFAGLRAEGAQGLLPADALLPGVDISATQAARDNALIAGEVEMAEMREVMSPEVKARWLNSQGYFTQTKPKAVAMPPPTLEADEESQLESLQAPGSDDKRRPIVSFASQTPSSPNLVHGEGASNGLSPTQETQTFSRLKRRASLSSPDQAGPSTLEASQPKNAFEHLMASSRRTKEVRERLRANNLVDEQAEEDDEDQGWMRVGGDNADDEDEGEDEEDEGFLKGLVDDEKVDDEIRRQEDELVAAKAREIEAADDAKREEQARKIIEGEARRKRRGMDFYSDESDEDGTGRKRRWSKKERKKRRLEREDGLDKLDGEENVFRQAYEEDLESDVDSIGDAAPMSPLMGRERTASPVEDEPIKVVSARDKWAMLRERAKRNRAADPETQDMELDREIGFDGAGFGAGPSTARGRWEIGGEGDDDVDMLLGEQEEESQFSITRSVRAQGSVVIDEVEAVSVRRTSSTVSLGRLDSLKQWVAEEAGVSRRTGSAAGASVVVNPNNQAKSGGGGAGPTRPAPLQRMSSQQSRTSSRSSLGGGSLLRSRNDRFG